MFKFAANLTFLFNEVDFLERFAAARSAGFRYVEFHNPFPFNHKTDLIRQHAADHELSIIHFNLPAGDWDAGDRGIAAWPDRIDEFRESVAYSIEIAQALGAKQLNCPVGYARDAFSLAQQRETLVANLHFAAEAMAQAEIRLLIEPLNPITHPGYLLVNTAQAQSLVAEVGHPNMKIQYDYYQMQRSEGELAETVDAALPQIGFIQLADTPGRQQPGTGEINFRFLLNRLAESEYNGFVSLEYTPSDMTTESFGWIQEYGFLL